jgi:membrane associated rhomboid family serine protease
MRILGYDFAVVETLIGINVIFALLTLFAPDWIYSNFSLLPEAITQQPWTIVTSMFLHADLYRDSGHLLFNMIALFFFGLYLERLVGEREFLKIYFLGGIFAGLAYLFTSFVFNVPRPDVPAVGASGAIFAVMGALVILRPKLLIFVYFVPMPLYIYAILYSLWALAQMAGTAGALDGVAHNAHLGGLIIGLYFGLRLKRRGGYEEDLSYRAYRGY